ncbi:MAG: hypothetical protein SFX74_00940 [Fimbriimonadaceae bacterium]|nr:hypothetical protein [Fimbriimonadaceae bacterium]
MHQLTRAQRTRILTSLAGAMLSSAGLVAMNWGRNRPLNTAMEFFCQAVVIALVLGLLVIPFPSRFRGALTGLSLLVLAVVVIDVFWVRNAMAMGIVPRGLTPVFASFSFFMLGLSAGVPPKFIVGDEDESRV